MIREILLVHHSHTDIGYTHPQPIIFELHRRFLDEAIALSEETRDWPEGLRFKWTCEVTGITLDWWRLASPAMRDRFIAAVRAGQMEVAGLAWNITPLVDSRMLLDLLEPVNFFREKEIPIRTAMNSDVNGVPWGLVDALLDHGITGFSMGVNEHWGHAPQPRPRGFWWESASGGGRKLLVWNGLQYWNAANIHMRIPEGIAEVESAMASYLKIWEERGYPYGFFPVQVTTASAPDNAAPDPRLPAFVRDWNARQPDVTMRLVTISEVFDRLRGADLPTLRGDWTDWWNFGCGSTARETALALEGERLFDAAEQLRAWPGASPERENLLREQAARALALYAEHTWGADRSVWKCESLETFGQLNQKLSFAYQGYNLARMLRRDGLERLAEHAGGEALTALFYNPLPFPVRRMLRVPVAGGEIDYLAEPRLHLRHRQDVVISDLPDPTSDDTPSRWTGPIEIPALGYVALPYAELPSENAGLEASDSRMSNGRIRVRFEPGRAGIASLTLDGVECARDGGQWRFAEPILERPAGGTRGEIFGPLDWRAIDVHQQWRGDWEAVHERPARILSERRALLDGCAEYEQAVEMPNGDAVTLTYRLFPDEPNLELMVSVQKQPIEAPHALYLPLPLPLDTPACHFETAGAVVELDREQIPYASRHYITTGRFIRMQDAEHGFTVACPDAPLWQVGGFTFARHRQGEVAREEPLLLAWLTNNYWDVNFSARQSGAMRFRFRLIPHAAEAIGASIPRALPYAVEPQLYAFRGHGPARHRSASLLDIAPGNAILTSLDAVDGGLFLTFLNPEDTPEAVRVAPSAFSFRAAREAALDGTPRKDLPLQDGTASLALPPRSWRGLRLE